MEHIIKQWWRLKIFINRELMAHWCLIHDSHLLVFPDFLLKEIGFAFQGYVLHEIKGIFNMVKLKYNNLTNTIVTNKLKKKKETVLRVKLYEVLTPDYTEKKWPRVSNKRWSPILRKCFSEKTPGKSWLVIETVEWSVRPSHIQGHDIR